MVDFIKIGSLWRRKNGWLSGELEEVKGRLGSEFTQVKGLQVSIEKLEKTVENGPEFGLCIGGLWKSEGGTAKASGKIRVGGQDARLLVFENEVEEGSRGPTHRVVLAIGDDDAPTAPPASDDEPPF